MKLSHISIGILLVSVFVASEAQAQMLAADSQSAVSSAAGAAQSASTPAEVPRLIKFSGTLLDAQERPVAGPVGVTFALYARQMGGAALWLETQNVKPDANGNYTVLLGAASANGVPTELFTSAEARWLGIQVGQEPEQTRILLVSVPYALKAKDAETLGGLPASAFVTTEALSSGNSTGAVIPAVTSSAGTTSASTAQANSSTTSTTKNSSAQPTSSCLNSAVTTDGKAPVNSLAKFTTGCNVEGSAVSESGGLVGIGGAPATGTKLFLTDSQSNFGTRWLQRNLFNTSATTNGTNTGLVDMDMTNMLVSAGVTDSGSRAIRTLAYANNPGFAGTLVSQFGLTAQAGIRAAASTAKVTNAYGGEFVIWNQVPGTTITNAYGVYISNSGAGGAITNRYDLFASSPNANNFFAGKVGIGKTTPAAKLDVEGTGGVLGHDTNTSGVAVGVTGVSDSTVTDSAGVRGNSTAATGMNFGVHGITASSTFGSAGVKGVATGTSGTGVVGQANGTSGIGVDGFVIATTGNTIGTRGTVNSPGGVGVEGVASATSGSTVGMLGIANSPRGFGVFGENNASTGGVGVEGTSNAPGGSGVSGINLALTGGVGVQGLSNAASGQSVGVSGLNASTGGIGVEGFASATTGNTFGMRGIVSSPGGIGVAGFASATTGNSIGTRGLVNSPNGTGVQGINNATTGGTGTSAFSNALAGTAALLNNTASGNIVIGQAAGVNKFRVDGNGSVITLGNAYLATAGNGVILKSPNGSICKMISIDNMGNPTFTTVTCPAGP